MAMAEASGMRDWWLRVPLVLQRPRAVFVALRESTDESFSDRAEPILAIVWLAGIAVILASSGTFLDSSGSDNVDLAIWGFLAGGLYGLAGYFAFGALVHGATRLLGSQGTYRRSRQLVAFASVPLVLSLAVWPFKIAIYGDDLFRTGGGDSGAGSVAFDVLEAAFAVWAAALLVLGIRAVHGWTWARSAVAAALALGVPTLIELVFRLI